MLFFSRALGLLTCCTMFLPALEMTIAAQPSHPVPPTLFGIFFEDINHGADGGLYAELVQNRSFEHPDPWWAWTPIGTPAPLIAEGTPVDPANPHYLRLAVTDPAQPMGAVNAGWDGIVLDPGATYRCRIHARHDGGAGTLRVRLLDEAGKVLAESSLSVGATWQRQEVILTSTGRTDHGRLEVLATARGTTDVDVVSLFPTATWKDRPNGLRRDLTQALADLHPGFLRFPGGCIVEGQNMANAYRWKDTIGDVATRRQNKNRWTDSFNIKEPQYQQTYGLGFFEYFELCEDLGAEPLPIINCGMSCQFEKGGHVAANALDPYIQDALDLVEFARGPATSTWGARRAAMGHPAPFRLNFLGVGNEQWGPEYLERYRPFHAALKARYPDLQLVMATGPLVGDGKWKAIMDGIRGGTSTDIIDEHFYRHPDWFLAEANRYDTYDRRGPKVFAGEYAAHLDRTSSLRVALAEAAMMTGFLRNADHVVMASYAPLFAKRGHTQWTPDLIYFDNRRVCLTPSYHVQALFGAHRPDAVLPLTLADNAIAAGTPAPKGVHQRIFAAAGLDARQRQAVVFAVNPRDQAEPTTITLAAGSLPAGTIGRTVLGGIPDQALNTLEAPAVVQPVTDTLSHGGGPLRLNLPPHSLTVLRVPVGP